MKTFTIIKIIISLTLWNSYVDLSSPATDYFKPDLLTGSKSDSPDFLNGTFPDNFIWAVASSAYQIEGGWNKDGKGVSIWDTMVHRTPNNGIYKQQTGDDACDSYKLYHQDVQLLKNMNVTIFHFDLPQALEDKGGWLSPDSPKWFKDYAEECFKLFGDRVKYWLTINQPDVVTGLGYGIGVFAPNVNKCLGTCEYISSHNIIKAHGLTYKIYNNTYRAKQNGKLGMTLRMYWTEPGSQSQEDIDAAERSMQFTAGWYANPIFIDGDYPSIMKTLIASKSATNVSRLPVFTKEESAYIKGSWDFFAVNTYTSQYAINHVFSNNTMYGFITDSDTLTYTGRGWPQSGTAWLYYTPWGMRKVLNWIKNTYGNPPVLITENGWSDNNGSTSDYWRIHYYKNYINNVLKAIKLDGCDVIGFTAWSLMDSFELAAGYHEKFGLHYINFTDPDRARTPKMSARYYAQIIRSNGFGGNDSSLPLVPNLLAVLATNGDGKSDHPISSGGVLIIGLGIATGLTVLVISLVVVNKRSILMNYMKNKRYERIPE